MTKEEFEEGYASRSGMTVEELHALGRRGYPCNCDYEECQGWQMLSENDTDVIEWQAEVCARRAQESLDVLDAEYIE